MASNHASQVISETAKAEGGPQKGSTSAQMQSEVARQRNAEQTNNVVGSEAQSVADKQAVRASHYGVAMLSADKTLEPQRRSI